MKLTIIRGLPGSGKSTEAKKLNVFHVEADMFCMKNGEYCFDPKKHKENHIVCAEMVHRVLQIGCDCVVSNTFTEVWEMQKYLDLSEYFGAEVEVVRMETTYESIHNVPGDVYEKMWERFEDYKGERVIN